MELSNLVSDKSGSKTRYRSSSARSCPCARKAQVIGNNQIERGDNFLIEAKTTFNDGVDVNTSFITFDVEVSPTGMDQWIGDDMIVGGDQVFQEGTSNEHRQYLVKPSMEMGAGQYDIRVRAIDSRMQTSDWQVTETDLPSRTLCQLFPQNQYQQSRFRQAPRFQSSKQCNGC